jgi:hypothetical protein
MQYPLGESLLLVTEFPMNARLAVFLTASGGCVVSLTFLLDSSVVEDECTFCPHRLAVEGGESNVTPTSGSVTPSAYTASTRALEWTGNASAWGDHTEEEWHNTACCDNCIHGTEHTESGH